VEPVMPLTKHQDKGLFLLFGHQCSSAWLHGFYSGGASIITFSDTLQWFGLVPCLAFDKTQFWGRLFPSTTGLCNTLFTTLGGTHSGSQWWVELMLCSQVCWFSPLRQHKESSLRARGDFRPVDLLDCVLSDQLDEVFQCIFYYLQNHLDPW